MGLFWHLWPDFGWEKEKSTWHGAGGGRGGGGSESYSNAITAHSHPKETLWSAQVISNPSTTFDNQVQLSSYCGLVRWEIPKKVISCHLGVTIWKKLLFRAGTNPYDFIQVALWKHAPRRDPEPLACLWCSALQWGWQWTHNFAPQLQS